MINELIEKEIDKRVGDWEKKALETFSMFNGTKLCALCGLKPEGLRMLLTEFGKTIAKEVAMRFKRDEVDYDRSHYRDYNERVREDNNLADQIINEVSE